MLVAVVMVGKGKGAGGREEGSQEEREEAFRGKKELEGTGEKGAGRGSVLKGGHLGQKILKKL